MLKKLCIMLLRGLNGFTGFTGFTGREICPFILVSTWPFGSVFFDFFALPFIWATIAGQPKECLGTYPELLTVLYPDRV
jgi:hypothetical protein